MVRLSLYKITPDPSDNTVQKHLQKYLCLKVGPDATYTGI